MKSIVIITSKFNIMTGERNTLYGKNETERFTEEWLTNRMDIFMKFTAKSLMKQTVQNFYALYVYEDSTEAIIQSLLSKYAPLPDNIMFIKKSQYNHFIDMLSTGYDMLYLTRLDSDDMYHEDFVNRLLNLKISNETQAIFCKDGYIYDSIKNKLAEYSHLSFTFYTFIYRLYKEKVRYDSLPITPFDLLVNFFHFSVLDYNNVVLPGRNFMFNIHSLNTDSVFPQGSFIFYTLGETIINKQAKEKILKSFFM